MQNHKTRFYKKNVLVPTFFAMYLVIGLFITSDYGLTWDEASQRYLGMISLDYVNEKCGQCFFDEPLQDQHLLEISNRHHGTLFPLLTHAIEVGFSIESERNQFLVRHYAGFLLFWLGSIFLYR
ncbi:MAG: hypothetical protein ACPGVB_08720, partial [Chitinophagales bacterium]